MASSSKRSDLKVEHVTKQDVRDYWNAHPLSVDTVPHQRGTTDSIEAIYSRWKEGIDEMRLDFLEACRGKRVLEVGCGIGPDARWLIENGIDYRGLDYSIESLKLCTKMVEAGGGKASFVNGDATAMPFQDDEFDVVFAIGMLHHIPDMERACGEVVRVTKPGGMVRVMLYHRHSYHYALVKYVVCPLIWLILKVPGLSALVRFLPNKFKLMYEIAAQHGFDLERLLNASTDTSYAGEGHHNPLSRFLTEREVRAIFSSLERFTFFRSNLSYFPIPLVRHWLETRVGFFLTFNAYKPG
jgi:ubiquinone/menaquinone biosynthesis C-methylase UbiE